jgi:4-pyridoxolactonase
VTAMPTFSVLIDHADGLFLFDTGFDLEHFRTAISPTGATQTEQQTIPGQLDLLGLRPKDINFVVNSHYHFDHCGGNKHCTHAQTICHKCELEASRKPEPFEEFTYSDHSYKLELREDLAIHTRTYETLTGDQEIAKGVYLFETPGHTLGHYSLMVKPGRGRPMFFPADACYSQKGLDNMLLSTSHVDPVRGYQSMRRVKELAARNEADIFFAHDEQNYAKYLKAPYWYE